MRAKKEKRSERYEYVQLEARTGFELHTLVLQVQTRERSGKVQSPQGLCEHSQRSKTLRWESNHASPTTQRYCFISLRACKSGSQLSLTSVRTAQFPLLSFSNRR